MQNRSSAPLWFLCILLLLAGCKAIPILWGGSDPGNTPVTGIKQEPSSIPEVTPQVDMPAQPGAGALVLSAKTLYEEAQEPKYEIDARWPLLEWDGSPGVDAFNQAAERFATDQVRSFKENLYGLPDDPIFQDSYSSLKIDFVPTNDARGIFAVLFQISYYNAGAAHPGHFSHAINYDLHAGKVLELSDLFIPGADYLAELSSACIEDLKARQVLEWEEGALPGAENYQVWNITPDGILVTFDEYQVASYAAGPQAVVVPYKKLAPLLREDGPLREYLSN